MSSKVFANGREIACKAASGKVIAAFPDVCFTPPDKVPPTPPGVPVPYPLTSMASDTEKGSKKVTVGNKEVIKRDSSDFKKCAGDNAAQTAKKGIINSKLTGKVQFTSWSMDVKFEGKNIVRHLDLTTSNHASPMANAASPIVYLSSMTIAEMPDECKAAQKQQKKAEAALPPAKKSQGHVTAGGYFSGTGETFKAASNVSASDIKRSPGTFKGFSKGVPPRHAKPKAGVSSVNCGGSPHEYRNSGSSPTGDAEAKIIENLFANSGGSPPSGTLYLKVVGAPVCCDCQGLMACASESIDIVVCPPARKDEC